MSQQNSLQFLLALVLLNFNAWSQGIITTIAGTESVFNGDGKPALNVPLSRVSGLNLDRAGNVVVADPYNAVVIRLNPDGKVAVLAGNGIQRFSGDGGQAVNAALFGPQGVAFDSAGNLYIADTINNRIRKVTPAGVITTVVGNGGRRFSGDGVPPLMRL